MSFPPETVLPLPKGIDCPQRGGYDSEQVVKPDNSRSVGMGGSAFRGMVSCVLLILFPGSLLAADSNAAMLYINSNGAACCVMRVTRPTITIAAVTPI